MISNFGRSSRGPTGTDSCWSRNVEEEIKEFDDDGWKAYETILFLLLPFLGR
jgi:hypothetical protein